jgi:hypothetical protein
MLKLLLDENVWPKLADKLRATLPRARIESLHTWKDGRLLHQSDERVLAEAHHAGWTLLTFDLATIPSLLAEKMELGEDHGGVILVSSKSFAQNDHGGLLRAIVRRWPEWSAGTWTNRVEFLRRVGVS